MGRHRGIHPRGTTHCLAFRRLSVISITGKKKKECRREGRGEGGQRNRGKCRGLERREKK
jgi:hypothetical protein